MEDPSAGLQKRLMSILMPGSRTKTPDSALSTVKLDSLRENIFIQGDSYGTRCSSVILFGSNGLISFTERRFNSSGEITGENTIKINKLNL